MEEGYEIKMTEPLISVIVPVYNVEPYLRQCVDSVICQTYTNLEIILVDDGSSDKCGVICDEYRKLDSRIVVIHKENGGLSDARNYGMRSSHGEYFVFVDSDDWMEMDGVSKLFQLSKKHDADIVIGGVEKFIDGTDQIVYTTRTVSNKEEVFSKEEAMKDFFMNGCASWARLYKRNIHDDVCFPKGEINEDEAIVLQILEKCNTIVKTTQVVYQYRARNESITTTKWNINKLAWYVHCKNNLRFIQRKYPELEQYAKARYRSSLVWVLNNMAESPEGYTELIPEYREKLKALMKEDNWEFNLSRKEKIRVYCLANFFYLYSYIVKLLDKHYT